MIYFEQADVMRSGQPQYKRQWRDYQTESGARPIKDFLLALPDEDRAAVLEEMEYVREHGTSVARHLRQDLYEVALRITPKRIASFLLVKDVSITSSWP
jgi:hypothetical protein